MIKITTNRVITERISYEVEILASGKYADRFGFKSPSWIQVIAVSQ